MATQVLVADHPFRGFEPERAVLAPLGVKLLLADGSDDRLVEMARGVQGILVCYAQVDRAVIQAAAAGGCRIVARYGIGYDNVDLDAATEAGMVVTNVPDYCLDEVADHTFALLLAGAREICISERTVRAGGWGLPSSGVHRLAGRTLALVGLGAIGRRVAARAAAFGLAVVVFDPYADRAASPSVRFAERLEDALEDADFISLHAPLTSDTAHIIGAESLSVTKRAPFLINTARGGLVDLDAVCASLDSGLLSGAALDVTEPEPLPEDHRLRDHPRVILTAHSAFYSVEAQDELQRRAAEEVARVLQGEPPANARNPVVLERMGRGS